MNLIFERFEIDTVLDIGANIGQFGIYLRTHLGFKGRIISFEPVPALAEKCRITAGSDGNWEVITCALGKEPGQVCINVMASSVFSSFLAPRSDAALEIDAKNKVVRSEIVEMRRLDDVLPPDIDLSRTYLKIDTQGFDLAVASGGPNTLARVPALQTELSFLPLYEGMPAYQESIAFFQSRGFAVIELLRVASDKDLRAFEFDCLMVRA